MTTTVTLDYSASLDHAELLAPTGHWHHLQPDDDERDAYGWLVHSPPQGQPMHSDGSLTVRIGYRYRAPTRLLSHRPILAPASTPATAWRPSAVALELGLDAPAWDGVGYLYLSAQARHVHIPRDTILAHATITLTVADAAAGAAAALRRAYLIAPAEQVVAAYERGPDTLCRVLGDIAHAAPSWIAAMPQQPDGQLHPARDLCLVLAAALAVVRGEPMPERMP